MNKIDKLDKLDFAILNFMNQKKSVTKISAVSIKSILEEINVKRDTLYRRLSMLIKSEYVQNGTKESREYTYYITEKGKETLDKMLLSNK